MRTQFEVEAQGILEVAYLKTKIQGLRSTLKQPFVLESAWHLSFITDSKLFSQSGIGGHATLRFPCEDIKQLWF